LKNVSWFWLALVATALSCCGEDVRKDGTEQRRSSIQVVELKLKDGWLTCSRDEPTHINLVPPAKIESH
jgi:hypothetical protein